MLYFEGGAGGVDAVPLRTVGNDIEAGPSRVISETGFGEIIRNYDTKPVGTGFVATERRKDPSKFTVVVHFDRVVEERGGAALASAP